VAAVLQELRQFNANDWAWLALIILVFFGSAGSIVLIIIKQLKQIKLSVGKDGVKLNSDANNKLDRIIERLEKLEVDVVALQIMNEHLTPEERLKRYDYYKNVLHGNSFIDEYIKIVKSDVDTTRFS
jgi:hypothetical protein